MRGTNELLWFYIQYCFYRFMNKELCWPTGREFQEQFTRRRKFKSREGRQFHIILSGHKFASQCSSSPVGDHSQFEFAFLSCLEGFLLRFCGCFIECDSRSNMIENKCIVNSVLRIARSFAFEHSGVQKQYNTYQCSSHCEISKLLLERSTFLSF